MKHSYFVVAAFYSLCCISVLAKGSHKEMAFVRSLNDTVYVTTNGDDLKGNGTFASPFYSLNRALEGQLTSSETTDTLFVLVAAGDYYMNTPLLVQTCRKCNIGRLRGTSHRSIWYLVWTGMP